MYSPYDCVMKTIIGAMIFWAVIGIVFGLGAGVGVMLWLL